MGNTFKTAFLLTLLTLLLMFIGRFFGGQNGMLLALVLAAVMNFVSYFYSDKIALAMYRAQPVTREELPRAYAAVERLTQKIGIPMPKIYVIPNEYPERVCYWTQPATRFGSCNSGHPQSPERRRTGRRSGVRTRTRE